MNSYQLQQQINQLRSELEQERSARIQHTAKSSLTGRVRNPEQFLTVLNSAGLLTERDGELQIQTSNGLRPLNEGIDSLLNEPGYSHFSLSPRTTGGAGQPAPDTLRYFSQDGSFKGSDDDLLTALAKDQNGLGRELAQFLGQNQPTDSTPVADTQPPSRAVDLPDDAVLLKLMDNPQGYHSLMEKVARSLGGGV